MEGGGRILVEGTIFVCAWRVARNEEKYKSE
jgi:hypothetical protein